MYKKTFGIATLLLILAIAIFHNVATAHFLYWFYPWTDLVVHFFAGLWVALSSYWVLRFWRNKSYSYNPRNIFIATFGVAVIIGILWEVFEYQIGLIQYSPWYINDTLADLLMDTIGGVAGFGCAMAYEKLFGNKVINIENE